jgi:hypothetical protein
MCCTAAGKEASFRVVDVSSGQFLHGRPASCVSDVAQISSTVLSAPCLSLPRGVHYRAVHDFEADARLIASYVHGMATPAS